MTLGRSLRSRTALIVSLTLIILLAGLYFIARLVMDQSFSALETQTMRQNLARAENALKTELAGLDRTDRDYGYWDDSYNYMESRNPEFIAANFPDDTFINNQLNLVLLVNQQGEIYYEGGFDLEKEAPAAVPASLHNPGLLGQLTRFSQANQATLGILRLPEGYLEIAAREVLQNNGVGPARGSLIMARWFNEARVAALAEVTQLNLSLRALDDRKLPAEVQGAIHSAAAQRPTVVKPVDRQVIAGYSVLEDIRQAPVLVLQTTSPREIYDQGQQSLLILLASVLGVGLLLLGLIIFLIERLVLARTLQLNREVNAISENRNVTARVSVLGQDELSSLGQGINAMLSRLEVAQSELAATRDHALSALRARSSFLTNISQDLRTPLNAILGYVEMLQTGIYGQVPPSQQETLHSILRQAQKLQHEVNELLDYSRLEAGPAQLNNSLFDTGALVSDILSIAEPLAHAKGLRLTYSLAPQLPRKIIGDFERLKVILLNLVDNALKFTDRGSVEILLTRPDERHWAMTVRDTGLGIPVEFQSEIFEPFQRAEYSQVLHQSGAGLGLSIVKQLTELMGGQVSFESQPNQGSTFRVDLPLIIEQGA